MTQQAPIKVTKLLKYKKELIKDIVNQSKFMLKDVFPHLNNQDYEIATYTYKGVGLYAAQIGFNPTLGVLG